MKNTYKQLINEKVNKPNEEVGVICKLSNFLPCPVLLAIYRPFVRHNFGYGDDI